MTSGLDRAEALAPGHGMAELTAAVTDGRAVLGADVEARLNKAISAFGRAEGSWNGSHADWAASLGLRARW